MSQSKEELQELVLGASIFEEGDFSLHTGTWPNPLWEGQRGYLMVNKRTGLVEGVYGTEAMGVSEVRVANLELQNALSGAGPVTTSDDEDFQKMMARLNDRNEKH